MVYFVSDAHLGSLLIADKHEHERKLVRWLEFIRPTATKIYLMGDIFDFWFEYKTVVPKGFVRLLGKLAEMSDAGIEIHFFTGNHDLWTFGYLEYELGLKVHRKPEIVYINGLQFFLAHGDGLDSDKAFRYLRKIFHSRTLQRMFRYFPIEWGQRFGYSWSKQNRLKHQSYDGKFKGELNENLIEFSKKYASEHPEVNYFVFGHRHIALDLMLKNRSRVIILGDFITAFTYGVFDGTNFALEYFES